ncbi:transposase domain-containing protein, partial [Dubosiella newyorkensis]
LFSGSPRGAKACGVLYSIVESAKANGLIPYKYILHLLKELSRHAGKLTSEILEECMPWNPNLISICQ